MANKLCTSARHGFSDHLDGERLPWWRALWVRCHLSICPACIRFNKSLTATRDALKALRDQP